MWIQLKLCKIDEKMNFYLFNSTPESSSDMYVNQVTWSHSKNIDKNMARTLI